MPIALRATGTRLWATLRPSKYGNVRTVMDGQTYHSLKEARRGRDLRLRERGGQIRDLERQVRYPLVVHGILVGTYVCDFRYIEIEDGRVVIEDVKSAITRKDPVYRLKAKLMRACYGVEIRET